MTFEWLMSQLFVEHWLFMTLCAPWTTFVFAWITDQTAWWFWSFVWGALLSMLSWGAKK